MNHYEVEITQNAAYLLNHNMTLPDILLIDYHMAGIDICGIIKQLKNNSLFGRLPIILMSGDCDIEKITVLLGTNDFIAKPFNLENLLNKIELCISVNDRIYKK